MGKSKGYSPEYKKEIIRLVTEQGKKVKDVALDIGVTETSVRRWIKEYGDHGKDAFPGKGRLRLEDEEIRRLKKELADIKEENAILKKAMCIFTRPEK